MMYVIYWLAIPALHPIIHDLFVLRGTAKGDASRDLETQREVVMSMLLRLNQYYQVCSHLCCAAHHDMGEL